MNLQNRLPTDSVLFGSVLVGFSSVCFGLVPFFARSLTEAGIAPPAIAFFRYMFAAVLLLPFLRFRGAAGRASLWGYVSGFCVGLGWVGFVKALALLPVAVSGVLYMTYPMFTLLIGWALFQDRPAFRSILGGALILIAAVLAAGAPGGAGRIGLVAVLLALAAPLAFGFAINVLAHKLAALMPLSRMAIFALGAATSLVPLILTYPRSAVLPATPGHWGLALGLGLFAALIPHLIYVTFVPRIGGARAAALGSIELPTMFAVGWIAFGEAVGLKEALAGVLVLTAICLTPARQREPARSKETSDAT